MKRSRLVSIVWIAVSRAPFLLVGPAGAAESGQNPPAVVEQRVKESDLTTITLTAEAEKRLGIATATVERRKLPRARTFGGEVIAPSLLSGGASAANGDGSRQSIVAILPLLTPTELMRVAESQIDADGQVERARVELEATKIALQRAERLLRDRAGSARAVDEARTQVGIAQAALRTAQARRDLLGPPVLDVKPPKLVWIRVPVYVGDLPKLRTAEEARVGGLTDVPGLSTRVAKPASGPPTANPVAASVDLYYELANDDGSLRFGEKVGVTIALQELADTLVVPWSAIVHDSSGGAWVYEVVGPQTFSRRRVHIAFIVDGDAALESGPAPGARVVTDGAAELFGTEFGVGH